MANNLKTVALLAFLGGVFVAIGWLFGGQQGALIALGFAVVGWGRTELPPGSSGYIYWPAVMRLTADGYGDPSFGLLGLWVESSIEATPEATIAIINQLQPGDTFEAGRQAKRITGGDRRL